VSSRFPTVIVHPVHNQDGDLILAAGRDGAEHHEHKQKRAHVGHFAKHVGRLSILSIGPAQPYILVRLVQLNQDGVHSLIKVERDLG
jgi:hypothetical protein